MLQQMFNVLYLHLFTAVCFIPGLLQHNMLCWCSMAIAALP